MLPVLIVVALFVCGEVSVSQDIIELAPGQMLSGELTLKSEGQIISLQITFPNSIWTLYPATTTNTITGTMVVEASVPWQIFVSVDSTTQGYLTEYDPVNAQFVPNGHQLTHPILIRAGSGNEVDLSKGGVLAVGDGSKTILLNLRQEVTLEDLVPLAEGHEYCIILKFTSWPADEV